MKRAILVVLIGLICCGFCFSWSDEEIEKVLGKFIGQNTFRSTDLKWDEIYSLSRQTLLRKLALDRNESTYYNIVTRVIDPEIIVFSLNGNSETVIGGTTSQIAIYIAQYERGTYMHFLVVGHNPKEPERWYNAYEHEIIFTKDRQNGWQTISTELTHIRNEINTDFLTIIRPIIQRKIADKRIETWNIFDDFFPTYHYNENGDSFYYD